MAQIQNTKLDRYKRHFKKKVYCTFRGLTLSAIHGRFCGPKVLVNSIPKAGTHLLETALSNFPLLRNAGKKTLSCWDNPDRRTLMHLELIGKGQFLNAHFTPHNDILNTIKKENISVLFVIRDPRDIAVSNFKYISEIDKTHWAHREIKSLPNDSDRLMASIKGIPGILPSIGEMLTRFQPWLHMENIFICRFEDLIGPEGGGNFQKQLAILSDISNFIHIPVDQVKLEKIAAKVFSGKSSTYRKGKVGDWQNYFDSEHINEFKNVANREIIAYGYEHNMDWQ